MKQSEIRQKIKQLKIFSKRFAHSSLSGEFASAFKGSGYEFHQLREYHEGDDIRFVDWNAYAKTGSLLIKELIPERDRTVILVLDNTKSNKFSSQEQLKSSIAEQVTLALAMAAEISKDKIALLIFSEDYTSWIKPAKGKKQLARIIQEIIDSQSEDTSVKKDSTKLEPILDQLAQIKAKNSLLFFISDFITADWSVANKKFNIITKKFETSAILVQDTVETNFPDAGILDICDPETGEILSLDTSDINIKSFLSMRDAQIKKNLNDKGIRLLEIKTHDNVINKLIRFFHSQRSRRIA